MVCIYINLVRRKVSKLVPSGDARIGLLLFHRHRLRSFLSSTGMDGTTVGREATTIALRASTSVKEIYSVGWFTARLL